MEIGSVIGIISVNPSSIAYVNIAAAYKGSIIFVRTIYDMTVFRYSNGSVSLIVGIGCFSIAKWVASTLINLRTSLRS